MRRLRTAVIGMGYVGLTSAAVFARHGFKSICTDIDLTRVRNLYKGVIPFYEPGLEELVRKVVSEGLLSSSTDNVDAVQRADVTFICVGTPSLLDGSADLSAIESAARDVGVALREVDNYRVVVVKSTVPPGTTEEEVLPIILEHSGKKVGLDFGLCMNPEFLREGEAIHDSIHPDRIVIGEYDKKSGDVLELLYKEYECPKLRCDITAAEMIKYAANSLLATKVSFANEFARICEKFNVDVYEVMKGIGLDFRINPLFLDAGSGFGGSCFPKDVQAIIALAKRRDVETPLLDSVLNTNEIQPLHLVELIQTAVGDLRGKVVAVLGLSFKPNTDDVRYSRALPLIEKLCEEGAIVKAYDPKAINNFKHITDLPIHYCDDWEEAIRNADLAVVQTVWNEIRDIKAQDFKRLLKNPIVVDGRRTYDPIKMISEGIDYLGIGWKNTSNR